MQKVYTGLVEALLEAAEGLQAERETSLACSKDVPGGEGHGGGGGLPQGHNDRVQGVVGRQLVAGAKEVCPVRFLLSLPSARALSFMMMRQEEDPEHPPGAHHRHTAHHHRG